jgi:hypothetical protein
MEGVEASFGPAQRILMPAQITNPIIICQALSHDFLIKKGNPFPT